MSGIGTVTNSTMLTASVSRRRTLPSADSLLTANWWRSSSCPSTHSSSAANFIPSFTASPTSRIRCSGDLFRQHISGYTKSRCKSSAMLVFQAISQKAHEAGLPFLVIGGYAVMAHGFVRATDYLDLLVQRSRRESWHRLLEGMSMSLFQEAPSFSQFNPPPGGGLPVDLMFVTDEVFER